MKESLNIRMLCCGILILASTAIFGQELQFSFKPLTNNFLAQKEPRYDNQENLCAIVLVSASDIKSYTFENSMIMGDISTTPGEARIYMAQGAKYLTIKSNKAGMHKFTFPETLQKGTVYELDIKLILPEDQKRKTLVMLEGGFHPSQTSFGVMAGIVAKHGAYIRFRSDFGSASADLECDDTGTLTSGGTGTPFYKDGATAKSKLSITGGYLYRFMNPLYGYAGLGYGQRTLAWETTDGELVKNTDHSASGLAFEIGAIGQYKNFALSLGLQTINFKYMELGIGIGYFF